MPRSCLYSCKRSLPDKLVLRAYRPDPGKIRRKRPSAKSFRGTGSSGRRKPGILNKFYHFSVWTIDQRIAYRHLRKAQLQGGGFNTSACPCGNCPGKHCPAVFNAQAKMQQGSLRYLFVRQSSSALSRNFCIPVKYSR